SLYRIYMQDAITSFESCRDALTTEDSLFLLQEIRTLFNRTFADSQTREEEEEKQCIETSRFYLLSEMMMPAVKSVCKAGHHSLALTFLDEMEKRILNCVGFQWIPLILAKWGVKIHSAMKADKESSQALTECARTLRSLPAKLGYREGHAVLEGCNLVVWAVETGHTKELSGPELLALFSFLEEHQERVLEMLKKDSTCQAEADRLRKSLCCNIYHSFGFAHDSMMASQAIESDKKRRELREKTHCVTNPIGNNDFDYEDEQKTQDRTLVYEGLHFNLSAANGYCTHPVLFACILGQLGSPLSVSELELMQGETEESRTDLTFVRTLLEHGAGIAKEVVMNDVACSPPLKSPPLRWLSCLTHESDCQLSCCSEPCLGRASARWALTQADLALHLDPNDLSVTSKLHWAALVRCKNVTVRLREKLTELLPPYDPAKGISKPSLMQDVVGRVYLSMAQTELQIKANKVCGLWKVLEAGLAFLDSTTSPALRPVRAHLMATKAIASLKILAAKQGCRPEELFSKCWTWNAPKEQKDMKSEQKSAPFSILKTLKPSIKNPDAAEQKQESKRAKAVKPKIQVTRSSAKGKGLVPMTPVIAKSKSSAGVFDFNTAVPTLACTPVQKVKCPPLGQKSLKPAAKLQFQVYEEVSPVQDKVQLVPAAPKRTKKLRFKVECSDESDSESAPQAQLKVPADVPKKRTSRRAVADPKTSADPPAEKTAPKRQTKAKRSVVAPRSTSSEEDEPLLLKPASSRRGRSRKRLSKTEESPDEPDTMRTIVEETNGVLDVSIEQLRTSDAEEDNNSAGSKDSMYFVFMEGD
ncbi:hypothetical protein XENOCAPTIV_027298, partial [Xenoophorus captivus]